MTDFDRFGAPLPPNGTADALPTTQGNAARNETNATQLQDILQIIEVASAECYVGDLFRRKFGGAPPDYPKHFVALYSKDGVAWQAVGYVNFWPRGKAFMGGGLVIEDRSYRTMPRAHRALLKSAGGIAEVLLGSSLKLLPDNEVVWGYVADTRAERVDLNVGFEHTHIDKIIAYWTRSHSTKEKIRLTEEIAEVGPF